MSSGRVAVPSATVSRDRTGRDGVPSPSAAGGGTPARPFCLYGSMYLIFFFLDIIDYEQTTRLEIEGCRVERDAP